MVFTSDDSLILVGEDYHKPLPDKSVGMQIYEVLKSADDPRRVLFIDSKTDATMTVSEFFVSTTKLATALKNAGYRKGDVIGICSENSLRYFPTIIASFYLGLVVAPISFHYTEYELSHVINISKPKMVFCSSMSVAKMTKLKETFDFIERIVNFDGATSESVEGFDDFLHRHRGAAAHESFAPLDDVNGDDVATLLSSSGTTGLPKCVMLTHRNVTANLVNLADPKYVKQVRRAVFCGILPYYHTFGFQTVLSHLSKLSTIVLINKFVDVDFLSAIERYKINVLWLVPPLVVFLSKSPLVKNYDLSHIEEIMCGGAPLGKEPQKKLLEILNVDRVVQGYGMTETTLAILLVPTTDKKFKQGSCGKVFPGAAVKVRDPESGQLMKPHEIGELCFKGDSIMKGYYNDPASTQLTFDSEGWLRTGDLGYYDEDGYFFIVDRLKELIKYKGFQVPPAEVEALLLTHPKIKDVGVVGKKDPDAGEICVAFVVPNGDITEEEVKEYVADHLSRPKHLHGGVRFLKELPRAPSGKILRRVLREQVA